MNAVDIVFTFADGRLAHDCAACGGRCCHLDGFALPESELRPLLDLAPNLALFARATRTENFYAIRGIGGRCPLLLPDARCQAHSELGYEAKPYVCKLYPANQLYRVGEALLVDLNPDCPIERIEEASADALRLDHEALRATLIHYAPIVRERAASLDPGPVGAQALLAAGLGARDRLAQASEEDVLTMAAAVCENSRSDLARYARHLAAFFGAGPASGEALGENADPDLALALPRQLFFALATDLLPPFSAILARLPRVVVALGWLAHQRRQCGEFGKGAWATHALCNENFELALWLAHLDDVPRFVSEPASLPITPGIAKSVRRLLHFIFEKNERKRSTLAEAFDEIGASDPRAKITTLAALPPQLWRWLSFS